MPRKPQPAPAPEPRRGRPAMKFNAELAEQFGITPGADPPRELVKVDFIPTPTDVDLPETPVRGQTPETSEDRIVAILREELDELGSRLARFGVPFTPQQQQDVLDYTLARLMGYGGGGAVAKR